MSEPWRKSAAELSRLLRAKELSAAEVVESALERLAAVNPTINAVVTQMPEEARAAAARVDAALARGEDPGVLAGVPVTVKVNADQAGHVTSNGLRIQRDLVAKTDNPVVANLRKAGAIIVGRTNTPAFSLRWFTRNSVPGTPATRAARHAPPAARRAAPPRPWPPASAPSATAPTSRAPSATRRTPAACMAFAPPSGVSRP